jgi:Protein of unknown function (DUF3108)
MRNFLLLISRAGLALLAPFATMAATLAAPPQKVEVVYDISRNGLVLGEVTERLEHGDGKYELLETTKGRGFLAALGTIRRSSRGTVVAAGLRPVEFLDERTGRQTARATFDWDARTLTMQFRGGPEVQPLPPNSQDRLSFLLTLAFAPPGTQPVSVSVADGGSVSQYVFAVVGRERLKIPAGEFDTLKIARVKDSPEDRRSTEIWLAPDQGHILVRMLTTDYKDGTQIDQVATKISGQ